MLHLLAKSVRSLKCLVVGTRSGRSLDSLYTHQLLRSSIHSVHMSSGPIVNSRSVAGLTGSSRIQLSFNLTRPFVGKHVSHRVSTHSELLFTCSLVRTGLSVYSLTDPAVYNYCSSVRPSVSLSRRPSVRSSSRPSAVRPSAHPSVQPSVHPSVQPSVCPSVQTSVRLFAHDGKEAADNN